MTLAIVVPACNEKRRGSSSRGARVTAESTP